MGRTFMLTGLLVAGLVLSQVLPAVFGVLPAGFVFARYLLTMILLAFIMIEVGREFEIDLKNKRQYAVDYGVAATAAAFPWIFVSIYFLLFLMPETTTAHPKWIEALLVSRFAAPTSAGVLFSMLAAAGLSQTWVFKKTRMLAIFDDLDTVLLMIPLQMLIVGFAWQLGGVVAGVVIMLVLGLKYYRKLSWPRTWPWIMLYAVGMVAVSETLYYFSKDAVTHVGLHIEILLPAFLLGCALSHHGSAIPGTDLPGSSTAEKVGVAISGAFMFCVGLSMPAAFGEASELDQSLPASTLALHVIAVTLLANFGKMFACLCYRKEATLRERLAVSVALFPRGEVGAGVLAISLSYGIQGAFVTVAFMSLALNLLLTGAFIVAVKKILRFQPQ